MHEIDYSELVKEVPRVRQVYMIKSPDEPWNAWETHALKCSPKKPIRNQK